MDKIKRIVIIENFNIADSGKNYTVTVDIDDLEIRVYQHTEDSFGNKYLTNLGIGEREYTNVIARVLIHLNEKIESFINSKN